MKQDIFLALLEFGISKPAGVSFQDILKHSLSIGFISQDEFDMMEGRKKQTHEAYVKFDFLDRLFKELFSHSVANKGDRALSGESYFKYVEYQELKLAAENAKDAQNESKKATRLSIVAIIISVAALIVDVIFNLVA